MVVNKASVRSTEGLKSTSNGNIEVGGLVVGGVIKPTTVLQPEVLGVTVYFIGSSLVRNGCCSYLGFLELLSQHRYNVVGQCQVTSWGYVLGQG